MESMSNLDVGENNTVYDTGRKPRWLAREAVMRSILSSRVVVDQCHLACQLKSKKFDAGSTKEINCRNKKLVASFLLHVVIHLNHGLIIHGHTHRSFYGEIQSKCDDRSCAESHVPPAHPAVIVKGITPSTVAPRFTSSTQVYFKVLFQRRNDSETATVVLENLDLPHVCAFLDARKVEYINHAIDHTACRNRASGAFPNIDRCSFSRQDCRRRSIRGGFFALGFGGQ
jgi:hypothetical protein